MDHKNYYAEAFFVEPGQCFRMVRSSTHGAPTHCPKPVEFQGQFRTAPASGTTCTLSDLLLKRCHPLDGNLFD